MRALLATFSSLVRSLRCVAALVAAAGLEAGGTARQDGHRRVDPILQETPMARSARRDLSKERPDDSAAGVD